MDSLSKTCLKTIENKLLNSNFEILNNLLFATNKNIDFFKTICNNLILQNKEAILVKIMDSDPLYEKFIHDNLINTILKNKTVSNYFLKEIKANSEEFHNFSCNIFDIKYNWDNCVVAGGSISKIITKMDKLEPLYISSDIDIYLYGSIKEKQDKLGYILDYFNKKFINKVILINKWNVIDIYIVGINRKIQIICGDFSSKYEIINNFDMSNVQVLFDGKKYYGSYYFIDTQKTKEIKIFRKNINEYRIFKALKQGFNFNLVLNTYALVNGIQLTDLKLKDIELNEIFIFKNNNYYYPENRYNLNKNIYEIMLHEKVVRSQINNYLFNIDWNVNFKNSDGFYYCPEKNIDYDNFKLDWPIILYENQFISTRYISNSETFVPFNITIENVLINDLKIKNNAYPNNPFQYLNISFTTNEEIKKLLKLENYIYKNCDKIYAPILYTIKTYIKNMFFTKIFKLNDNENLVYNDQITNDEIDLINSNLLNPIQKYKLINKNKIKERLFTEPISNYKLKLKYLPSYIKIYDSNNNFKSIYEIKGLNKCNITFSINFWVNNGKIGTSYIIRKIKILNM
jgi:hypothetical protein